MERPAAALPGEMGEEGAAFLSLSPSHWVAGPGQFLPGFAHLQNGENDHLATFATKV